MTNMKIACKVSLCVTFILMIQLPVAFADLNIEDIMGHEYNIAAGRIPESSGVLNFNMTPLNSPGLLFYDIEEGNNYKENEYESINFSVKNAKKIPADSFVYRTSMHNSDDGELDIAWLGQHYSGWILSLPDGD